MDKKDTAITWDIQAFRGSQALQRRASHTPHDTGQEKKHHGTQSCFSPDRTPILRGWPVPSQHCHFSVLLSVPRTHECPDLPSAGCFLPRPLPAGLPRFSTWNCGPTWSPSCPGPHAHLRADQSRVSFFPAWTPHCASDSHTQLPTGHSFWLVSASPGKLIPAPIKSVSSLGSPS